MWFNSRLSQRPCKFLQPSFTSQKTCLVLCFWYSTAPFDLGFYIVCLVFSGQREGFEVCRFHLKISAQSNYMTRTLRYDYKRHIKYTSAHRCSNTHKTRPIYHAPQRARVSWERRYYNNSINKQVYFPSQQKRLFLCECVYLCVQDSVLVHKDNPHPPSIKHTPWYTHAHTASHHLWRNNGIIYIFSPARDEASKFSAVISCLCALPPAITVCGVFLLLACPVS